MRKINGKTHVSRKTKGAYPKKGEKPRDPKEKNCNEICLVMGLMDTDLNQILKS